MIPVKITFSRHPSLTVHFSTVNKFPSRKFNEGSEKNPASFTYGTVLNKITLFEGKTRLYMTFFNSGDQLLDVKIVVKFPR